MLHERKDEDMMKGISLGTKRKQAVRIEVSKSLPEGDVSLYSAL